jgi:hypothetical protein
LNSIDPLTRTTRVGAILGNFGKYRLDFIRRTNLGWPQGDSQCVGRSLIGLDRAFCERSGWINKKRDTRQIRNSTPRHDAKAVVLDLVNPTIAGRRPFGWRRQTITSVCQRPRDKLFSVCSTSVKRPQMRVANMVNTALPGG